MHLIMHAGLFHIGADARKHGIYTHGQNESSRILKLAKIFHVCSQKLSENADSFGSWPHW